MVDKNNVERYGTVGSLGWPVKGSSLPGRQRVTARTRHSNAAAPAVPYIIAQTIAADCSITAGVSFVYTGMETFFVLVL